MLNYKTYKPNTEDLEKADLLIRRERRKLGLLENAKNHAEKCRSNSLIDEYKEEIMNNTYEAWVMMDSEIAVVSEEHDTPDEVLVEMMEEYTIEEMHANGFTLNKLLCDGKCWLECLDEIDY